MTVVLKLIGFKILACKVTSVACWFCTCTYVCTYIFMYVCMHLRIFICSCEFFVSAITCTNKTKCCFCNARCLPLTAFNTNISVSSNTRQKCSQFKHKQTYSAVNYISFTTYIHTYVHSLNEMTKTTPEIKNENRTECFYELYSDCYNRITLN